MTTILKCLEDIAECCKAPGNNSQILVSSTSSVHWSHPGSCSWSLPRGVGGMGLVWWSRGRGKAGNLYISGFQPRMILSLRHLAMPRSIFNSDNLGWGCCWHLWVEAGMLLNKAQNSLHNEEFPSPKYQ